MRKKKTARGILLNAAIGLIAMVALVSFSFTIYVVTKSFMLGAFRLPVPEITTASASVPTPPVQNLPTHRVEIYGVQSEAIRNTTAYVAGDPKQTDDQPCISADGSDICKGLAKGEKICAANFVPLGTRLYVEGVGICIVKDRLSTRYKHAVDIAMPLKKKKNAKEWGRQKREVQVLK
jgi:3D (Asp-Asp-Asp) domain-containing protein